MMLLPDLPATSRIYPYDPARANATPKKSRIPFPRIITEVKNDVPGR